MENKKEKIKAKKCAFCPRMIIKAKEIEGKYFFKQGRVMCVVCRAVRGSKFKKQIKADAHKMWKDIEEVNKQLELEEQERIFEAAADSLKHDDSK